MRGCLHNDPRFTHTLNDLPHISSPFKSSPGEDQIATISKISAKHRLSRVLLVGILNDLRITRPSYPKAPCPSQYIECNHGYASPQPQPLIQYVPYGRTPTQMRASNNLKSKLTQGRLLRNGFPPGMRSAIYVQRHYTSPFV